MHEITQNSSIFVPFSNIDFLSFVQAKSRDLVKNPSILVSNIFFFRLLTRVEILESQLSTYGKSMNEDKLREETKRLMEEKEEYQDRAKDTLKRLVNEKLEAVKKAQDIEKTLSNTEDEYATLKEMYEKNMEENKKLATEINRLNTELGNENDSLGFLRLLKKI